MNFTRRGFLKLLGAAALLPVARALPAAPPVLALVEEPAAFGGVHLTVAPFDLNAILQEVYGSGRIRDLVYRENAFLRSLP